MKLNTWPLQLDCHEALWLRKVLREIGHAPSSPTMLRGGNNAALALLHNVDMMPACVKHIDSRHHACKEQVMLGNVAFTFYPSLTNIADCLPKAVYRAVLKSQKAAIVLRPLVLPTQAQ